MKSDGKNTRVDLFITIGPSMRFADRLGGVVLFLVMVLAVPVVNAFILNDHWALHLVGAAFGVILGLLMMLAHARQLSRSKRFDSAAEAGEWVSAQNWREG